MLSRDQSSEGLDYTRYKTDDGGSINFESKDGHILSLVEGSGTFVCANPNKRFYVKAPLHIYIPKNFGAQLNLTGKCLVIQVSAPGERARGEKLIIRNEKYARAVRYVLTSQYISRRIFLHRDKTLLSIYNQPVSIFRTTMFDATGLPVNFENKPVFKMGYDYQSEPNIVYDVKGNVSVRFAKHPYVAADKQQWSE